MQESLTFGLDENSEKYIFSVPVFMINGQNNISIIIEHTLCLSSAMIVGVYILFELRHEETSLRGFRPGLTQSGL